MAEDQGREIVVPTYRPRKRARVLAGEWIGGRTPELMAVFGYTVTRDGDGWLASGSPRIEVSDVELERAERFAPFRMTLWVGGTRLDVPFGWWLVRTENAGLQVMSPRAFEATYKEAP